MLKKLVIVDDDAPFRERLGRSMEKKGFLVTQAEGVKAGLESIKSKTLIFIPSLIIALLLYILLSIIGLSLPIENLLISFPVWILHTTASPFSCPVMCKFPLSLTDNDEVWLLDPVWTLRFIDDVVWLKF